MKSAGDPLTYDTFGWTEFYPHRSKCQFSLLTLLDEPDFTRTGQFVGFGGRTMSQRQIASGRTTLPQSQNQA